MPYRVFLNAPNSASLKERSYGTAFSWRTVVSQDLDGDADSVEQTGLGEGTQIWLLPPETFSMASQRISKLYKNVIFPEDDENEQDWDECNITNGDERTSEQSNIEESLISWPPTIAQSRTFLSDRAAVSDLDSREYSLDASYAHTSTSSITAFPAFVINLHTLTALSDLTAEYTQKGKWSRKVNLLVAVLEVEGPDVVRVKKGPDAGREVGVLKLVFGSEKGGISRVTAWRETAEVWGGINEPDFDESMPENEGVKKGDIVYLENIFASSAWHASEGDGERSVVSLTASPNLGSRLHICFRSLPTVPSDRRFRPDLRLAASDPGLREVAGVAHWLEGMMGLSHA